MQKFDTPAPIATVLDIPAGRIRFIAADRADTTVEVLPADASKSRDVKAAEQIEVAYGEGVLRIEAPAAKNRILGNSGSVEVTVQLPMRLPHRGQGGPRRTPGRRTARRRRLRGRAGLGQARRDGERPPHSPGRLT